MRTETEKRDDEARLAPLMNRLTTTSRTMLAHEAYGRAVERIEALAVEAASAFEELAVAEQAMGERGVDVRLNVPAPLTKAWDEYRSQRAVDATLAA